MEWGEGWSHKVPQLKLDSVYSLARPGWMHRDPRLSVVAWPAHSHPAAVSTFREIIGVSLGDKRGRRWCCIPLSGLVSIPPTSSARYGRPRGARVGARLRRVLAHSARSNTATANPAGAASRGSNRGVGGAVATMTSACSIGATLINAHLASSPLLQIPPQENREFRE